MLLMYASCILLLSVITVCGQGSDNENSIAQPCCYPNRFKADVLFRDTKWYTFYIDYSNHILLEDWSGKIGTDYILYDLKSEERYRRRMNGMCRKYPLRNIGMYARCIPDNAQYVGRYEILEESGDAAPLTVAFRYMMGSVSVLNTVQENGCLPAAIEKTRNFGVVTIRFENVSEEVDQSVFKKDVSDCH